MRFARGVLMITYVMLGCIDLASGACYKSSSPSVSLTLHEPPCTQLLRYFCSEKYKLQQTRIPNQLNNYLQTPANSDSKRTPWITVLATDCSASRASASPACKTRVGAIIETFGPWQRQYSPARGLSRPPTLYRLCDLLLCTCPPVQLEKIMVSYMQPELGDMSTSIPLYPLQV